MEIFQDPWVVVCILVVPLVIIGLARSWKRLKEKNSTAEQSQPQKEGES